MCWNHLSPAWLRRWIGRFPSPFYSLTLVDTLALAPFFNVSTMLQYKVVTLYPARWAETIASCHACCRPDAPEH